MSSLYRNVNLPELFELAISGRISGKMHKENKDSDYSREKHGEIVYFFDREVELPAYDALLKVRVPKNKIVGSGVASYHNSPPCSCCDSYTIEEREIYVREYEIGEIEEVVHFFIDIKSVLNQDEITDLSIYIIRDLNKSERFLGSMDQEELKGVLTSLTDEEVSNFSDYNPICDIDNQLVINRVNDMRSVLEIGSRR